MKTFFWAADADGQAFWRMKVPAYGLHQRGHTIGVSQTLTARWQTDADAVIGARVSEPQPSAVWARLGAERRTALVYDVDDDYLNLDPSNDPAAVAFFARADVRARIEANARLADIITTVSPRLADTYARYGPTVCIPNGLPAEVLNWQRPQHDGELVIGWAGSTSTLPELRMVASRLRRFLDRHAGRRDIEVHTIGVQAADIRAAGLRHPRVRVTPWLPAGPTYLRGIDFDIWLAPYRSTEFNRCKAPTKAIEAAFLGVPIIASDIEPYRDFIDHGHTGFVATRDHDWDTCLAALVDDPDLRTQMGAAARVQAADHTIERYASQWERALTRTAVTV